MKTWFAFLLSLVMALALAGASLPAPASNDQSAGPALAAFSAPGPNDQTACKEEKEKKKDKKDKKDKKEKKGAKDLDAEDQPRPEAALAERELTRILRDMQFALEGGSPRSFLGFFDSGKFDDYPRFEDMIERLMREDTIRAHFRTAFNAPPTTQGKAQALVDVEMELGRKDGVGQLQRRKQQLAIDFEYTRRGWRIINLTPRNFFQPL